MSAGNIPIPNTPPNEGYEGRRFVGNQIYDALFGFDLDQGDTAPVPQPALAESYELSDDQLTWTFALREGVTFHDGTPFDADSVIFNFDRVRRSDFELYDAALAGTIASSFAEIASYAKTGDMEVSITTRTPFAWLPYDLALIYFASPEAVRTHGNQAYVEHATGTGPFRMTRYVDGEMMELTASEAYWGGRPALDTIELYPMAEPASRLAALQSGDVDWAEVPPPDAVAQLEAEGFQVLLKEYPHIITYQLDTQNGPTADVRVRRALNYAVDREGMAALVNDVGYPATQYAYEGHKWYDPDWEGYEHDPDRARQLLAEAGYADGLKLQVAYPTGGSGNMFPGPMNEKLQADLREVGVDVELSPMEWNTVLTAFRQGIQTGQYAEFDALYFSHAPMFPTGFRSYVSDYVPPDGCCNTSAYSNPAADALFDQAASTFDEAEQDRLLREFQSTMMRDAPVLVTLHDLNLRVLAPEVQGFVQPQSWFADLTTVWVDE
jgi:peptide/nickel transport system substrate-binding protein